MIERIRKKYAMTEKGAKDYVAAVFWSVLVNISKMLPVGVLATALSGIVEALTNGTDPGAGLTRFLVAGVLALAALFVTFLIQYRALYEATGRVPTAASGWQRCCASSRCPSSETVT